jgi:predicted glycosyltransferase
VVTTGGGGDGYEVMDAYLGMLESQPRQLPMKNVFITGPFMPKRDRKKIFKRAKKLKVRTFHFYRNMEKLLAAADVVVSMGGYNTICELLSFQTAAVIIPRETPRKEQLIRAEILHRQGLIEYIPWSQCNSQQMQEKIFALLEDPTPYRRAISEFSMNGIATLRKRLSALRSGKFNRLCEPILLAQRR